MMTAQEKKVPQIAWELPKKYLAYGVFDYIDLSLVAALYPNCQLSEEGALLVAFLSTASRAGHLCVKFKEDAIEPSPALFFNWSEEDFSLFQQKQILQEFELALKKGRHDLPADSKALIIHDQSYYFQKFWALETALVEAFLRFMQEEPSLKLPQEAMEKILKEKVASKQLTEKQSQAIGGINRCGLTVITGGPGTGKTYTAGQLIDVILKSLDQGQREDFRMGFAAPTGKAAANLQGSLLKSIQNETLKAGLSVSTLHSLLEIKPNGRSKEYIRLPFDLLIVDEASMIDFKMMARLFFALKKGSRLILLGDRYQLPPIEAGSPFTDLIALLQNTLYPPVELVQCLRAELAELVELAAQIKQGKVERIKPKNAIRWHALEDYSGEDVKSHLLKQMQSHFARQEPQLLLHSFKKFRILCSLRQGPLGVDALNDYFYSYFKQHRVQAHPIMIVNNDERLNLFNGEVGILENDQAFFLDPEQHVRKIPSILLPKYEFAYCLSVHKSQGSEFDHVVFVMPEGSHVFGREMLYTAVTRTRQILEIWTKETTFQQVLQAQTHRISSFYSRASS